MSDRKMLYWAVGLLVGAAVLAGLTGNTNAFLFGLAAGDGGVHVVVPLEDLQ